MTLLRWLLAHHQAALVRISGLITLLANMGYKSLLFPFFYGGQPLFLPNTSINKHVIAKFFSFFSFAKKSANCQAPHEVQKMA